MACGITGDYIDQMLKSTEKESEKGLLYICPRPFSESSLDELEVGVDQEEVKGGTHGG